jgi:hypothetical protein
MKRSNKTNEMHHAYVINIMFILPQRIEVCNIMGIYTWHTPKFFDRHNCESKGKTIKEGVGVRFLARSILKVEGHVVILGWGLGWMTSASIIHTDLHKPNKLISV